MRGDLLKKKSLSLSLVLKILMDQCHCAIKVDVDTVLRCAGLIPKKRKITKTKSDLKLCYSYKPSSPRPLQPTPRVSGLSATKRFFPAGLCACQPLDGAHLAEEGPPTNPT